MFSYSPTFQHLLFSTEEHYIFYKSEQGVLKRADRLYLSHIQYLNGPQNPRQQKYKTVPKAQDIPIILSKEKFHLKKKF